MKYFIDSEFSERGYGQPIELISIAIIAEDGRELYGVNADFDWSNADEWLHGHVRPFLFSIGAHVRVTKVIAFKIREFIGDDPSPEFWGYFCGYDFVVLSQLMGGFEQWPDGWPFYMRDLRQWLDERGFQRIKQPDDAPHNALQDARWVRDTHGDVTAPGMLS